MNLSETDQFLVDSVQGKSGCTVVVDYSMEPLTMKVSPDVFSKLKEFSDRYLIENYRDLYLSGAQGNV